MRFSIQREALLKPLQQVVGVVERRQTLPVLANLLVVADAERITFTGTDLEVEMSAAASAQDSNPARSRYRRESYSTSVVRCRTGASSSSNRLAIAFR
jgi:DNA polymerase III sliding clamp (beta) subunit (PCNA family)